MKIYKDIFKKIISLENLFLAWKNFKSDKQNKIDVQRFEWRLEQHIFQLHRELENRKYKHGRYSSFYIQDPKQRHIHKAAVRDRVLHHAVFSILNPVFEPTYIANSFSCRIGKGTHKGVFALGKMIRKESKNYTKPCFVLKCDIKKFFDSVDHKILLEILNKRIKDMDARWLLKEIVRSFSLGKSEAQKAKGLPIGNLTSQMFADVYMNEFDQFVKQKLKAKFYARYTDDFVLISQNKNYLEELIEPIKKFLKNNLVLELHPKKVSIRKMDWGIDFLGYVTFPFHRLLRAKTKQRILKKLKEQTKQFKQGEISEQTLNQSLQSYLGVLIHANTYRLSEDLKNQFWFWLTE